MPFAHSTLQSKKMPSSLEVLGASLPGVCDPSLPLAVARAGGVGILNLIHHADIDAAATAAAELRRIPNVRSGLMLSAWIEKVERAALEAIGQADLILLRNHDSADWGAALAAVRPYAMRVGAVVTSLDEARVAIAAGCDLVVAKGHEAGGLVGEETSFVLVQALLTNVDVPVYVWGGISWNTAAACAAAGCAGVLLDWQLALLRESPLGAGFRRRLSMMDGSEVATVALPDRQYLRFYHQPGMTARAAIDTLVLRAATMQPDEIDEFTTSLLAKIESLAAESRDRDRLWLTGQDASLAADWARQAPSVGRALQLLAQRVASQVRAAAEARILDADSPLANSHGTRFPVVQGPMTRVSDVPEFCHAVAAEGGLPFLALALLGEAQVRSLLERTKEQLGDLSWGVGMLGFVPQEIRAQQWPVIQEIRPPYAIIAGGRPDQAASLEANGIATYLHVPSPGMLDMFLREGARRFVFEGRECGGHVGPRTSFVLWELMVRVLSEANLSAEEAAKVHVLFAGGIHDRLGAAMVSVLAQPLVERGMKVGVLLGTAYLFTHEIVATGAIVEGFQSVAIDMQHTMVVESGPGHAVRCAPNDFVHLFEREKRRMVAEGCPHEEMRAELEHLNLGRLRVAAKGVQRGEQGDGLVQVDGEGQLRDGMYMIGQVAALRQGACSLRELHEEVCLGAVETLAAHTQVDLLPPTISRRPKPLDIAVVGMSCLVPGATDPSRLWHNVLTKFDPITEIPADRFEVDRWFNGDKKARDKIYGRWGGFVDDLPFDPLKYGIPPASIPSIEPMQLLAMELVDRALSDAGYAPHNPLRERTSIILGVGGGAGELGSTYAFRAMLPRFLENPDESLWQQLPEWTEDSFAGILFNVVAGRVSNRFDLGGANCTVDAACASSLSALYWACHDLSSGNCDMVITGGCDTMQNPFGYLCFAKAGALSAMGRARVFDTKADGIVISEGHAAVVLKRREDAERDGDKIYAVIRAVSGGSDGRSMGLTAPRVEGQLRTLRRAYEQAGVDPASVALFEAHGTGTSVGDQTECRSLTTLLEEAGAPQGSIAVGSIKSMIGHTKCAAGAVGLVKTIMAMQHRVLPPTMHVDSPNPKGGLVDGPLFVNTEARPWLAAEGPRRAGVSSFGFGGTNFHVLLEEYDRSPLARPLVARRDSACELFVLRADTAAGLRAAARSLATDAETVLANKIPSGIARLAYTHHLRSQVEKPCQMAVVAGDLNELVESLRGFDAAVDDQGKVTGKLPPSVQFAAKPPVGGKLAFLFPGQGSQFPGMLQELAVEYSEVAACFQRADDVLRPELGQALSQAIFPPSAFTDADRAAQAERLKDTRLAQPALGVSGRAVEQLLDSFGVRPQMTAGHSFGELVALCSAGAMSETELFHLAAARGQSMAAGGEAGGTMLAVGADGAAVEKHLADRSDVWVANLNSPRQTVLSGTEAGIAHVQAALEAAGITARRIPVSAAFHSPFMQQPRTIFSETLAEASFAPPHTPVYANVSAEQYNHAGGDVCLSLAEQLTDKVRWVELIENMYRDGARIFVEVGAKGVLTGLVRDILKDREHVAIATQPSSASQVRHFLGALGQLISQGVDVSLDRLYDRRTLEPLSRKELTPGTGESYPAHVWLVNGAYSRKVGTPLRSTAPLARLGAPAAEPVQSNGHVTNTIEMTPPRLTPSESQAMAKDPASNGHSSNGHAVAGNSAAPPQPERRYDDAHGDARPAETNGHGSHSAATAASPVTQAGGSMDGHSYALFQETMRQFLATQQSVLAQLFGGGQPIASIPAHSVHTQPHYAEPVAPRFALAAPQETHETPPVAPVAASPAPEVPQSSSAAAPAAQAEVAQATVAPATNSARFSADDLQSRLAATVADRTGYPAEMLSLDINLEGELGIDSIKRVEIIAAFRREVLPEMLEPPAEFMERLAGAKTMRQIVDVVAEMSGAQDVEFSQPAAESPAISADATLDPDDLLTTLLRVVADRTGYPAEMLDLDINLEGELGIDSIKRVEIIAAFRREVLPEMLEPPAQFMEQLAGAKTMRAIIDVIVAMSGTSSAEVSSPSPSTSLEAQAATGSKLAIDASQLEATLVRIVADRTGYPAEMLTGDVNLESELGIDSIKRVEIIAAFRRDVRPDLVEAPPELMERLAGAKTVRAILNCFSEPTTAKPVASIQSSAVKSQPAAAPTTAVVDISAAELSDADGCPRCVADIVEAPITHVHSLGSGAVIVVAGQNRATDDLIEKLLSKKIRVERLSESDLAAAATAKQAVDRLRRAVGSISAVAHLLPLDECLAWPAGGMAQWNDRFNREVRSLLFLLQALEPELSTTTDGKLRVLSASIGGSDFATDESTPDATHPWRGGLAGLLKVAACEWPQHAFRAVDFTELPPADVLLEELTASGPVEIGYRAGRRLQIQTRRIELSEPNLERSPLTADSTVIVTGGAKGITAAIVTELAKRVPARFVLLGRSALSTEQESPATAAFHTDTDLRKAIIGELRSSGAACTPAIVEARLSEIKSNREVRRNLAAIADAGGAVEYIPCDIRNAGSLKQMLADVQSRHGAIHGIIHGAGVIDDRHIKDKTAESFDHVVQTKVDPLLALLEYVDRDALKLIALFSSTSGFFGNSGQCDYAAANEVLNRIARRLRSTWNGKVVSFNWGPWAGAGMVTAEVAAKMRAGGIDLIPLSAGCAAACREMLSSDPTPPRVIMGRGPWLQDEQLRAGMDFSAYGTLLGGPLEPLPGGGFVARVVLDRNSRYLQDHRIEGKAVLPVAMAVGLMAEAAHLTRPEWHVAAVENVRMLSGITIEHDKREILVRVEPFTGETQTLRWLVSIRPVEMPQRILYDAHVELSSRPPVAPEANFPDPIETELEATASEAYDRWLFHGPSYKVIQAFAGADERGIDAIVRPGDDGASTDGVLDHVVIDAAPQLAMIWSRALFDVAVLPNRISSYRVYEPIGAGEVEMKLRIRPGNDRQVYNADVWIVRDGRLIAHMEGLEGAGSPQLNRIAVQL